MNYGEIKNVDIANGPGCRVSLFVSGCTHHCKECFNPMTWDFAYGYHYDEDTEKSILKMMEPEYIQGITLIGGEPWEPDNQKALLPLLRTIRHDMPLKDIWSYSGYTMEELLSDKARCHTECTREMLSYIDVLVDGEFHIQEKDISLRFRGSRNQRIIDVKKSLASNDIITLS